MPQINILKDYRAFQKFCKKYNQDMYCREIFGCNVACPLFLAREVELLMGMKNLPLGEAYRLVIRESIPKTQAIKDVIEKVFGMKFSDIQKVLKEKE